MWVIANGAPKTGSTWLIKLLQGTQRFKRIPKELQDQGWKNPSVRNDLVQGHANELAASDTAYMSKQHWADTNKDLLALEGIKILNSIRDIRDTLVSRYYHDARKSAVSMRIEDYIREKGPYLVRAACEYQEYWIRAAEKFSSAYYVCSYERLSKDYDKAAKEMFDFCELNLSAEELAQAVDFASFESQKNSGPGKFFRKGKMHAFEDDLTERDAEFLISLASDHRLREIKNRIADFNPNLRPYLEMTDVGL
jgi:sulfotransferase family protein